MKELSGFTFDEYLTIFKALVYGHITSQFFSNWAEWIQNRKHITFSGRHIAFTIFVFVLIVDLWWVTYNRIHLITETQGFFFLSLLVPINLYILAVNLFPSVASSMNLDTYFERREQGIYLLLGLNFLLNFLVASITGEVEVYSSENLFRFIGIILCIVASVINRETIYSSFLLVGTIIFLIHIYFEGRPPTLNGHEGFSFVEYVAVYSTFFFGYIAYMFFMGWAFIIQRISKITFSKEYIAWTILAFALLIDFWWGSWNRQVFSTSHLGYFLLSLLMPLVFYILATVMFPVMRNGDSLDLRLYFRNNEQLIYKLFGLIFLCNIIVAINMEDNSVINSENVFRLAALLLTFVAILSKSVATHRVILVAAYLILILHVIID